MTSMVYTNCTDDSLAYILHFCVTITVRDPLVSGVMAVPLGLCEIVPLQWAVGPFVAGKLGSLQIYLDLLSLIGSLCQVFRLAVSLICSCLIVGLQLWVNLFFRFIKDFGLHIRKLLDIKHVSLVHMYVQFESL